MSFLGRLSAALLAVHLAFAGQALAVNPDEVLSDPALEERARKLSLDIRCLVCQNQSIDDSNATLARDLRLLVRERLTEGDSDQEVLDYLVERYGAFVLLEPPKTMSTLLLWATPIVLLLLGGIALVLSSRRKTKLAGPAPLSADEQARIDALLNDEDRDKS